MSIDEAIDEFDFFNEGDYITKEMATSKDIVLKELQDAKADLYEANNRINDLLDTIRLKDEQIEYIENEYGRTIEQKDKIIDLMARAIDNYDSQLEICQYKNKEDVIKAFEELENMINIRKKKREESKNAKD